MRNVSPRRRRRKGNYDPLAKRRREIVLHAKYVGAADTADLDVWLTQWAIHNPTSKDEVWAVMMAARKMGGEITEERAETICDEAALCPHIPTAAQLGKTLRLTLDARTKLKISTFRPHNMSKADLDEIRRCKALVRKRELRRARGAQSREEYLANSLSATKPWEKEGVSERTWYRNKRRTQGGRSPSAPSLLIAKDTPVPPEGAQGWPSEASPRRKEERGLASSRTATTLAADGYASLPLELRLLALGLPLFAEYRAAA